MYSSFNSDVVNNAEASTKYTDYLKTFDDNFFAENSKGGGGRQRSNQQHHGHGHRRNQPLQSLSQNEVKFSKIFSPHESNALKLQLMQKTGSLPILDPDSNNNGPTIAGANSVDDVNVRNGRRRSTASGLLHANGPPNNGGGGRKGESVANILYSTIRRGHEYDNPSTDETLHTGSDSKIDYDPHEPLPAIDQIALRHELLNNIRAISRATYFEDLYTGKVRRNSGSPEAEIIRLLENAQGGGAAGVGIPSPAAGNARTIPSKETNLSRVDRWVKESSEASSRNDSNDTDEEKDKTKPNASLYHQTMWKEDKKGKGGQGGKNKAPIPKNKKGGSEGTTTESSYTTAESDVEAETAAAYIPPQASPYKSTKFLSTNKNAPPRLDTHLGTSRNIPTGMIDDQYLRLKYLGGQPAPEFDEDGRKRPFSFGINGSDDIPLSVSLPNVAQTSYRSTPVPMHDNYSIKSHSTSRPENLNYSTNTLTKPSLGNGKVKKGDVSNNPNTEQVRRVQQKPFPGSDGSSRHTLPKYHGTSNKRGGGGGVIIRPSKPDYKVPGIYARLNMNQWVMKKVWFYVNGDEHFPRFEYRFRHGKDIRDMDQLLDLLTKRFTTLPTGARFIFTVDGYLISSLEELVNENSYVVSSTRKFKALKYGEGAQEGESGSKDLKKGSQKSVKTNSKPHQRQRLQKQLSVSDGNLNTRGLPHPKHNLSTSDSRSVSDVPRLVAHVIAEAAVTTKTSSFRQPIRVINGLRPSLQSQVLLNTRTSQPFEDLVRDLARSVRIPKQPIGNALQTLAGRQIQSYSQLRSELKGGQRTFYVFSYLINNGSRTPSDSELNRLTPTPTRDVRNFRNRNGKPMSKTTLGKADSNSSSELVAEEESWRKAQGRRRSRSQLSQPDNQILYPGSRFPSRSPTPQRLTPE